MGVGESDTEFVGDNLRRSLKNCSGVLIVEVAYSTRNGLSDRVGYFHRKLSSRDKLVLVNDTKYLPLGVEERRLLQPSRVSPIPYTSIDSYVLLNSMGRVIDRSSRYNLRRRKRA